MGVNDIGVARVERQWRLLPAGRHRDHQAEPAVA